MYKLFSTFYFEAAHQLASLYGDESENARLHGHSFRVKVVIKAKELSEGEVLVPLDELESHLNHVRQQLDHRYLNEIDGLEIPTLERIAIWIWQEIANHLSGLDMVGVYRDSCNHGCEYYGS